MSGDRRLLVVLIAGLAGCDLATANISIPRTCLIERGVAVPGAVAGINATTRFTVDVGDDLPLLQTDPDKTQLSVDQVTITPTSGNPSLGGVTSAVVQIGPQNTTVASYTRTQSTVSALLFSGSA